MVSIASWQQQDRASPETRQPQPRLHEWTLDMPVSIQITGFSSFKAHLCIEDVVRFC